jgi:DNA-binding NarL/FixJ family response regulator
MPRVSAMRGEGGKAVGIMGQQEIGAQAARLTPTQLKVLQGVHSGLLNKQIAYDLGIAEATVKAHMTALMRKLNVRNRTQVAIIAQSMGYGQRLAG